MAMRAVSMAIVRRHGRAWTTCSECHWEWPAEQRYLWWPVRFRFVPGGPFRSPWRLHWWGIESERDALLRRTFVRVIGFGAFRLILGKEQIGPYRSRTRACPNCGAVSWTSDDALPPLPLHPLHKWAIDVWWSLRYGRQAYMAGMHAFDRVWREKDQVEKAVVLLYGPQAGMAVRDLMRMRRDAHKGSRE